MIIATHTNEATKGRTEFQQVGQEAFEIKRYRAGYNKGTYELSGSWYFDAYDKAKTFFNQLTNN